MKHLKLWIPGYGIYLIAKDLSIDIPNYIWNTWWGYMSFTMWHSITCSLPIILLIYLFTE